MPLPTSTYTIDEITTRHLNNYVGSKEYKDNFYKGRPLLMLARERKIDATGGKNITHRVNLGSTYVGRSIRKGTKLDLTDVVNETHSTWTWSVLEEPWVMYFHDEMESDGSPEAVIGLAEDKMNDNDERMRDMILTQLCQTSKADALDLNTFRELIPAAGTTAVGGLDGATAGQTAWTAQNVDAVDFSSVGIPRLRRLHNLTSQGGKHYHDVIVLPRTFHEEALEVGDSAVVINQDAKTKGGTTNAALGLTNLSILNRPAIWDQAWTTAQTGTCLMLNFDGIHLVENPKYALKMTKIFDALVNGLDARVAVRRYVAQLTMSNRGIQGSMTTVT